MKLRIWHVINIPGPMFYRLVPSVEEGIKALDALAAYDLFLGDGTRQQPWTTVGARQTKRIELAAKSRFLSSMFSAYNKYQLERCPGGVPIVYTNVQGLEVFEAVVEADLAPEELENVVTVDGVRGMWVEFYNDEGDDVEAIRRGRGGLGQ